MSFTSETSSPGDTSGQMSPTKYYGSNVVFDLEKTRIFAATWVCIGRAEHLGTPGEFLTCSVAGESIVVIRGEEGRLRAFHNNCRHRGTSLCHGRGVLQGPLVCPYHGWAYHWNGDLATAPLMNEVAGFRKSNFPLRSVGLAVWAGFMFINLSADAPSIQSYFGDGLNEFLPWRLEDLRTARIIEYEVSANWKIVLENYAECYHCPLVHPDFDRKVLYRSGVNRYQDGALTGGSMVLKPGVKSLTASGDYCAPLLRPLADSEVNLVHFYTLFPTLTLSVHPDYVMVFVLKPIAFDRTIVVCSYLFRPEVFAAENRWNLSDAAAFWHSTNREDWDICARVQEGIRSRAYVPSPFSEAESLPRALVKLVSGFLLGGTGGAL